jgi:hypothetical protein
MSFDDARKILNDSETAAVNCVKNKTRQTDEPRSRDRRAINERRQCYPPVQTSDHREQGARPPLPRGGRRGDRIRTNVAARPMSLLDQLSSQIGAAVLAAAAGVLTKIARLTLPPGTYLL